MDPIDIFTNIIVPSAALVGLGLSVFNTYQNWKNNQPSIKIYPDYKLIYDSWPNQDQIKEGYDTIVIANCGMKTITLSQGFVQDYCGILQKIYERLPFVPKLKIRQVEIFNSDEGVELLSWRNYVIRADGIYQYEIEPVFGKANQRTNKIVIVFVDQIGNRYYSKPFLY